MCIATPRRRRSVQGFYEVSGSRHTNVLDPDVCGVTACRSDALDHGGDALANFGDRLGVGIQFGGGDRKEIALRIQHFSNAGSNFQIQGRTLFR